jgi:hypothetical protein
VSGAAGLLLAAGAAGAAGAGAAAVEVTALTPSADTSGTFVRNSNK